MSIHLCTAKAIFSVCLIFVLGLAGVSAADLSAALARAATMLENGEYIEALEAYSRAAGVNPRNRLARAGIRHAKNRIREQMGDVSADKVVDLLDRLERLDSGRVLQLTARISTLENERGAARERMAALERDLATARYTATALATGSQASDSEREREAALRSQLAAARRDEQTARQTIAELTRQIGDIQNDSRLASARAEDRLRQLEAAAEIAASERQAALLGAQAAAAENQRLRDEARILTAKVETATGQLAPAADEELARLTRTLREIRAENRNLAAALTESRAPPAPPVAEAVAAAPSTNLDHEAALRLANLRSERDGLQAELASTNGEKNILIEKIVVLQRDLLASRAAAPNRHLRGIARRVTRQGVEIERLEQAIADAQERSLELLNDIKRNDSRYRVEASHADQEALRAVAALQKHLAGLGAHLPSAVAPPPPVVSMAAGKPVADSLHSAGTQLVERTMRLTDEIMAAAGTFHSLRGEIVVDEDGISSSLNGIDDLHRQATDRMELLKRRLRELETRFGDAG